MMELPFVLTAVVISIALVSSAALAQTPERGGTLRVTYGDEIAPLDFHTAPGHEMASVAMNVGCGLVNITPDGKVVGDAAGLCTCVSSSPSSAASRTASRASRGAG
jgi:hypothetical protein